MKKLILMQGAPGCGKSTNAQFIAEHHEHRNRSVEIHSADCYWYRMVEPDQPEKYSWDSEMSGQNHIWNQKNVLYAMERGVDVIIVDNTNTMREEANPYLVLAQMFDYSVEVVRVDPGVEVCVARQAARPEDRRVPEEVIRKMHARMEDLL
jgi:predicted kinase